MSHEARTLGVCGVEIRLDAFAMPTMWGRLVTSGRLEIGPLNIPIQNNRGLPIHRSLPTCPHFDGPAFLFHN